MKKLLNKLLAENNFNYMTLTGAGTCLFILKVGDSMNGGETQVKRQIHIKVKPRQGKKPLPGLFSEKEKEAYLFFFL